MLYWGDDLKRIGRGCLKKSDGNCRAKHGKRISRRVSLCWQGLWFRWLVDREIGRMKSLLKTTPMHEGEIVTG